MIFLSQSIISHINRRVHGFEGHELYPRVYYQWLVLVVLGTELTHGLGSAPHLALAQSSKFLLKTYTIVGL